MHREIVLILGLALTCAAGVASAAERIVSLSGDITEVVFACGAAERLVGVDSTSLYPAAATALAQVGYVRNLSAEGVLSLNADLVIGTTEAGPPEVVQQIADAGLEIHLIAEENSVANVKHKIREIATLIETPDCAARLIDDIDARLAEVTERVAFVPKDEQPSVLFILNVSGGPPLAGGADTGADSIIRLAGGRNAAAAFTGYKPMASEAIVAARPDVVVMFEERLAALGGAEGLAAVPGMALTPALAAGRVYGMNGLLLLGFGPRIGEAAWQLSRLLYPVDSLSW